MDTKYFDPGAWTRRLWDRMPTIEIKALLLDHIYYTFIFF